MRIPANLHSEDLEIPGSYGHVSIAMGTYNGEKYLAELLASLAQQTVLPQELVVTDDGSTDGTLHILEDFAKTAPFSVRVFRNETRLGFGANFLKAASLCEGDFIAFCDQDDVWLAHKIARCLPTFKDPRVVLVSHSGQLVDENLVSMGRLMPHFKKNEVVPPFSSPPLGVYYGFSLVCRASFLADFREVENLRPDNASAHDVYLTLMANVFGYIAFVKDPLVLYRQHNRNTSGAKPLSLLDDVRMVFHKVDYKMNIQWAKERSEFFAHTAKVMPQVSEAKAKQGERFYSHLQGLYEWRDNLYATATPPLPRFKAFICLLLSKAYTPPRFGVKAILKDVIVLLLALTTRHAKEE